MVVVGVEAVRVVLGRLDELAAGRIPHLRVSLRLCLCQLLLLLARNYPLSISFRHQSPVTLTFLQHRERRPRSKRLPCLLLLQFRYHSLFIHPILDVLFLAHCAWLTSDVWVHVRFELGKVMRLPNRFLPWVLLLLIEQVDIFNESLNCAGIISKERKYLLIFSILESSLSTRWLSVAHRHSGHSFFLHEFNILYDYLQFDWRVDTFLAEFMQTVSDVHGLFKYIHADRT